MDDARQAAELRTAGAWCGWGLLWTNGLGPAFLAAIAAVLFVSGLMRLHRLVPSARRCVLAALAAAAAKVAAQWVFDVTNRAAWGAVSVVAMVTTVVCLAAAMRPIASWVHVGRWWDHLLVGVGVMAALVMFATGLALGEGSLGGSGRTRLGPVSAELPGVWELVLGVGALIVMVAWVVGWQRIVGRLQAVTAAAATPAAQPEHAHG